jgi:H-type lectin domain
MLRSAFTTSFNEFVARPKTAAREPPGVLRADKVAQRLNDRVFKEKESGVRLYSEESLKESCPFKGILPRVGADHLERRSNSMKVCILLVLLTYSTRGFAQDCSSVIALSKTVATTVSDQESVEKHASNFCREYARGNTSTTGTSFGASFKFLSASFGQSNASTETVASKYCSASDSSAASKDAFRQYVENISPNAYYAYEQCLKLSRSDLTFNVNVGSILPTQFTMSAAFASRVRGSQSATVLVSSSDGIACTWRGVAGEERTLQSPSTAVLDCRRSSQGTAGFVSLVRSDGTGTEPLTLQWPAYDQQGNKIDTVAALQSRLGQVENKLSNMMSEQGSFSIETSGTRPLTDTSQCPQGDAAYRGQKNGRVNFAREFPTVPRVMAALSQIDLGNSGAPLDTHRLSLNVTEVDRKGFNYRFVTWCTTAVHSAAASWIALAQ